MTFPVLQSHFALLETEKQEILNLWMEYPVVQETLCAHRIKHSFYAEHFGSKVIDFALSVINQTNMAGDCPVIGIMLAVFKKKNIPLSDVFLVCVHLKNAWMRFLLQHGILDEEALNELAFLMDFNFSGVIKEYVALYYHDEYLQHYCEIVDEEIFNSEDFEPSGECELPHTTSALEYMQEVDIDSELIDELTEIENEAVDTIEGALKLDQDVIDEGKLLFHQYCKVLNQLLEFKELAYALMILADLFDKTGIEGIEEESYDVVLTYLSAIVKDLQSWRNSVFVNQDAEDIHYLDKTLLSSIAQLQIMFMPQSPDSETEEIEFF